MGLKRGDDIPAGYVVSSYLAGERGEVDKLPYEVRDCLSITDRMRNIWNFVADGILALINRLTARMKGVEEIRRAA